MTLLLLAALLIRLPWIFVIPVSDAPDEAAHLWVIDFLRTHFRLPAPTEIRAAGSVGEYGSLPQMGYLPHVFTTLIAGHHHAMLAARLGSLLMCLLTITAAYFIGKELFVKQHFERYKLLSLALPVLIALQPQFIFVSCYCNNDSTASAIASWIIYLLIICMKRGLSALNGLLIGLLLSWLTLCKYSGLSIIPVVFLAVCTTCMLHKPSWRAIFWFLNCLIAPYAVLVPWWFLRNYREFGGDVLGTGTMYRTWAQAFNRRLDYYMSPLQIVATPRWWRMLFYSFWGTYGHMNRYLWNPVYFVYLGYLLESVYGWLRQCWNPKPDYSGTIHDVDPSNQNVYRSIWLIFASACLINLLALVWAGTGNLGGPQGRYLFSSIVPLNALLLGGFALLGTKTGRTAVVTFLAFNFMVALGSWIYLYSLYGLQRL